MGKPGTGHSVLIAVAGDPNRANALAMANDGPHGWWTSNFVDTTGSLDLACRIGDDGRSCENSEAERAEA